MEEVANVSKPEKLFTAFDEHLQKYEVIFHEAYQRVMAGAKDEIKNADNFVSFVVRAMQAVKDADLHGLHKKEMVVDIVRKVVEAMPIPQEEKDVLKARTLPAIENIIDALVFAAKGYMYLKHQVEEALNDDGCVKCQSRCIGCCRDCKRGAAPTAKKAAHRDVIPDSQLDLSGMVDEVYNTVKKMIHTKDINISNLVSIGSTIMQVVEEYPTLVGYQKKQLVLRVVHRLVDDLVPTGPNKDMIQVAIDTTLDKAIDFIVKASRGEIEIVNKIVEAVQTGCAKCTAKCC